MPDLGFSGFRTILRLAGAGSALCFLAWLCPAPAAAEVAAPRPGLRVDGVLRAPLPEPGADAPVAQPSDGRPLPQRAREAPAAMPTAPAPAATTPPPARPLVTGTIDPGRLTRLAGNTRPEALDPATDRGRVADALPLSHMLLQLRRPPEREAALEGWLDRLQDPAAPEFHHWLSAAEFGAQFGPATADVEAAAAWLAGNGFHIDAIYPSRMLIGFSGTAGQVRAAFHAEIHNLLVQGEPHIANIGDPQVPSALAPLVVGVVSLHDFRPRPQRAPRSQYTLGNNFDFLMVPADLATIYNFNPLFAAGISGEGQTIAVAENSDLYSAADWMTFRSVLGLAGYAGALTTTHPGNCTDPGVNEDAAEAILDAEWASAAAPSAAIAIAACADTNTTSGVLLAIENLVNGTAPPPILSVSYGECEATTGAAANAAFDSAYQQGAAEGISIFVSSGDQAADACEPGVGVPQDGIGVNGWASTAYNVAVGGTDFADYYFGVDAAYWSAGNGAAYGSALSYVPEIPWNESCASQLIAGYLGFDATYGTSGFCNSEIAVDNLFMNNVGGGGGPSGCATGAPAAPGVVGGSCAGYAKPAWQTGVLGIPADGVRDLPDVALFASAGVWGHYYLVCYSDAAYGGSPCTGAPGNWTGFGGTSFSAPIMAGIQALANQHTGAAQGNPNPTLYRLAAQEYGGNGNPGCNSNRGNQIGANCIFYNITQGDMDVDCSGSNSCFLPSGQYGVLSTAGGAYAPAFAAGYGWSFATGLGSVNAYNLVMNWSGGQPQPPPAPLYDKPADFNGDGTSDLLWRYADGNLAIWEMKAGQPAATPIVSDVPIGWQIAGTGDFFGTGDTDLLWRYTDGSIAIWQLNGGQVVSSTGLGQLTNDWTIVGTGNFFGPGKAAILWRYKDGTVAVWQMNGAQVVSSPIIASVDNTWHIAGVGDFFGSGTSAILWRNDNGGIAIWQITNGRVTGSFGLGTLTTDWTIVGTGDFFGTGKSGILWRHVNGTVAAWQMNGAQVMSAPIVSALDSTWQIVGTGDFFGTGTRGILFRSNQGGVAIWGLTGGQVSNSVGLGVLSNLWTLLQ